MGWERKRGKLMDLNQPAAGHRRQLSRQGGRPFRAAADSLCHHPGLRHQAAAGNRSPAHRRCGPSFESAIIDPKTNTVVEGYAILQPRVGVSIESSRRSRLAAIYSGQTGFDIYTHAISDVYQDLFGEGSFTGKGIYEVGAFQKVLGKRFPTNALLSHDLIEGAYARAGLVSDIVVIDDYPSHFSAYSRRLHRWVRGDWQIMRWLCPSSRLLRPQRAATR